MRANPGPELHPRVFFNTILKPSFDRFVGEAKTEWLCKAAVANADTMAERMFWFWDFNAKDETAPADAREQSRRAVYGCVRVSGYRTYLASNVCADFQLVWDIHDAHKHVELNRENRVVTRADQTGTVPMTWENLKLPWSRADFSWDDTDVIFVTRDNGEMATVTGVLRNVMAMWEAELSRTSL